MNKMYAYTIGALTFFYNPCDIEMKLKQKLGNIEREFWSALKNLYPTK